MGLIENSVCDTNLVINLMLAYFCDTDFFQALIHGLNGQYYSIGINHRKNEFEEKLLLIVESTGINCALTASIQQ